jgi:signal transduction histidine kinase
MSARPLLPFKGSAWTFAIVLVGGATTGLVRDPFHMRATLALALGMIVLGLLWRSMRPGALAAYFFYQCAAATYISFDTHAFGALVLLPVLFQVALLVPPGWVWLACLYAVLVPALATYLRVGSWLHTAPLSVGPAAGAVFVVGFTLLLRRERALQQENEGLIRDLAATEERARIARDMHDVLGHSLTAVHAQLSGAMAIARVDPAGASSLIASAQQLTEEGLREVRRSVSALRSQPTISLLGRLDDLLKTAEEAGQTITLTIEGDAAGLSEVVALTGFRVAQECVTNHLRHAASTHATLRVSVGASELRVEYENDGPVTQIIPGAGLTGMQERVAALGGSVDIQARATGGTRLVAIICR